MIAILLPFARRYWREAAIVALLVVVYAAWHQRDLALKRAGALEERIAMLSAKLRVDSAAAAVHDVIVMHDTIRLRPVLAHYDSVRTTLVNVHDTVEVVKVFAAADTAIRACRVTVLDLVSSCAAKDTVIADLRRIVAAGVGSAAVAPSATGDSWLKNLLLIGLGVELHQLSIHPPRR